MKKLCYLCILIHLFSAGFSQEKLIDFDAYKTWPVITERESLVSNNGKYISYTVVQPSFGRKIVVQATDMSWKMEVQSNILYVSHFTSDNQRLIFSNTKDSVGIIELGTNNIKYLKKTGAFTFPLLNNSQWLAYRSGESDNRLIVRNLLTDNEQQFNHVTSYKFSDNGKALLLYFDDITAGTHMYTIKWVNLDNNNTTIIYRNAEISNITFDKSGTQCAFVAAVNKNEKINNQLLYYKSGMDSAIIVADQHSAIMQQMNISPDPVFFNKSGDQLFFYIEHLPVNEDKKSAANTDVQLWYNYEGQVRDNHKTSFLAVLNLKTDQQPIRLEQETDTHFSRESVDNSNYLLVEIRSSKKKYELNLNDFYCVSTLTGERRSVKKSMLPLGGITISQAGKYFIWSEIENEQYFTFDLVTGITRNITSKIPVSLFTNCNGNLIKKYNAGMLGWSKDDEFVFINDNFDIWMVDPKGIKPPVNITNGYGAKHSIRLRVMNFDKNNPVQISDTLLVSGYNTITKKDNSFFQLYLLPKPTLVQLSSMSKLVYFEAIRGYDFINSVDPMFPLKADHAKNYLVTMMSIKEYPNLYTTHDFKTFKQQTFLAPQKEYNWITTELIKWKLPDGEISEGILHKPQNFDNQKKYPVIFYYYERNSEWVNRFMNAGLSNGGIDIAWYVSNGYLVFTPDIHYRIGHTGQCAYESITSAAKYLSQFPWVNAKKMGIQGHSHGGFETNYIVSHTSMFAAAAPSSGVCNIISKFNFERSEPRGESPRYYITGQGRIGVSLWTNPTLYIENSPILRADKIVTPLLILHNKNDYPVPFTQGSELFAALKYLNKKAWFLNYRSEGHTIDKPANQLDYTIRLSQFFDYYLKDKPAPVWMTKGENSYELDPDIKP
jgi:dienelactone hydrolase